MNPVVHFEMPYDNRERMATFYGAAFGWQTQMLAEDMGNYVLATTTETDATGPKKPGAINGGFFPKKPDWPAQHPSRYCWSTPRRRLKHLPDVLLYFWYYSNNFCSTHF